VLWTKPNSSGHDVEALPGGHVLFTINPKKTVVELDANHNEVWSYSEGLAASARRAETTERQYADQRSARGQGD
jgi:hypothetical protein